MSFGERLQEVRRSRGLTQERFAEELHVSRQAVSKWESSRGYPEIEKILYICNRYHVAIGDLFADEVPLPPPAAEPAECGAAEPPPEAGALPSHSLRSALSAFLTNLSPKNKWLAGAILAGVACLSGLIGLCLKGGGGNMETIIWIGAIVIFGVAEALTAGLVSIWFVLGAVAGLITAVSGGAVWLQVALFFVVSIAALILTRPLVRRMNRGHIVPTNADRVLGGVGRVTERIDNTVPTGAVYIDGKTWTARSESGEVFPVGALVQVSRMEGVKLYVTAAKDAPQKDEQP